MHFSRQCLTSWPTPRAFAAAAPGCRRLECRCCIALRVRWCGLVFLLLRLLLPRLLLLLLLLLLLRLLLSLAACSNSSQGINNTSLP